MALPQVKTCCPFKSRSGAVAVSFKSCWFWHLRYRFPSVPARLVVAQFTALNGFRIILHLCIVHELVWRRDSRKRKTAENVPTFGHHSWFSFYHTTSHLHSCAHSSQFFKAPISLHFVASARSWWLVMLLFLKFWLPIGLHSSCHISPTDSGTFQKCFTKYHDWPDATQCISPRSPSHRLTPPLPPQTDILWSIDLRGFTADKTCCPFKSRSGAVTEVAVSFKSCWFWHLQYGFSSVPPV